MYSFKNLRPLLIGVALSVALIVLSYVVSAIVGTAMSRGQVSVNTGFQVTIVALFLTLVLPSLVAGWLAGRRGAVFGLVLGTLPVVMALFSRQETPLLYLVIYLIISSLSGMAGQAMSKSGGARNSH